MSINVGSAVGYLDLNIKDFVKGLDEAQEKLDDSTAKMKKSSKRNFKGIGDDATEAGKKTSKGIGDGLDKTKKETDKTLPEIEKKHKTTFKNIGNYAVTAGKTIAAGLAAGIGAFSALSFKALTLSGELEQNLGGSLAVFGEYTDKMKKDAETAFNSMGLSVSDFLATSNKMGALLKGVGFDIEEAADLTTQAMQRAADVASIMGIDVGSAMEAITGAAKGNFEMMDNLGVAMNEINLQAYALSKGISKATKDMTTQEKVALAMEMFLEKTAYAAGNYAKENETLAGSFTTAKAAMKNFLDGSGNVDDVAESFSNFATVVVKNLGEMLPRLITGLSTLVSQLAPQIPTLLTSLVPSLVEGGIMLVTSFAQTLPTLFKTIYDYISKEAPGFIDSGIEMLTSLSEGFIEGIPFVLENMLTFLENLGEYFTDNAPIWIEKGFEILSNLLAGIMEGLPTLIERLPEIITTFANVINANFPTILAKGFQLLLQFIGGIISAIPTLIANLPQIIQAIVATITAYNWLNLGKNIIEFFGNGIKNMVTFIKTNAKSIADTVVNEIKQLPNKLISIGKQAVEGLWKGIVGAKDWLTNQIKGFVEGIIGSFMSFFQIGSPSKQMEKKIGKWLPPGIAIGFENSLPSAMKTMYDSFESYYSKFVDKANELNGFSNNVIYNGPMPIPDDGSNNPDKKDPKNKDNPSTGGGDTYNFYSPKALDEIEAARQMKKARRDLLEGFE